MEYLQRNMELQIEQPDREIEKKVKENWDRVAKPLDGLGEFEGADREDRSDSWNRRDFDREKSGHRDVRRQWDCRRGHQSVRAGSHGGSHGESWNPQYIGVQDGKKSRSRDNPSRYRGEYENGIFWCTGCKVRMGTRNFRKEPAMTDAEAEQAIETGMELVRECKEAGYTLLGTGEMGIGNTTTSAAMAAALLGVSAETVTGRGAGLSDAGLLHKQQIVREALEKYRLTKEEPMRILCTVGGLDIAGLCGVFLGGAKYHVPIVADGVISAVAALTAERLAPGTREYVIPSHRGKEPASDLLMRELQLNPIIDAGLALGEGTGAVMMFSLLDLAMTLYESGATFRDFEIEQYERFV